MFIPATHWDNLLESDTTIQLFPYIKAEVGGKSKDQLLAEMKAAGHHVSTRAEDFMSNPAWKPGRKETVRFSKAKVRDLGFTKNPTIKAIFARIRKFGYTLCKHGDGPAIRLALKDQLYGDVFYVAMEQISDSDGSPTLFCVAREFRSHWSWLSADCLRPDYEWPLDTEIVFRPRPGNAQ